MKSQIHKTTLIVGIGNTDRGDDGAGNVTAERLRSRLPSDVKVLHQAGEGTDLINLWQTVDVEIVYLIDATFSDLPAGTIQRFEAHTMPLPAHFGQNASTHAFGLVEAIELARVLGCLPCQVIVYGIEGRCFDLGAPLSGEVQKAALKVAECIMTELFSAAGKLPTSELTV